MIKYVRKIIIIGLVCTNCHANLADSIRPASPVLADVQAAINAANPGDTVIVPAGSATWDSDLTINKSVKVIGAGIGKTIVSRGSGNCAVLMTANGARFSGFEFVSGGMTVRGQGWRIDHVRFGSGGGSQTLLAERRGSSGLPTGVIDNCDLLNTRVIVSSDTILDHEAWREPSAIGTGNAVYVEDCYWTGTTTPSHVDTNYGGRYVVRYNRMEKSNNGVVFEVHSLQGNHRASRSWEIYENTIVATGGVWCPALIRGGTGVVFNNTFSGNFTVFGLALDNIRSWANIGYYSYPPGVAAGLPSENSLWDGNTEPYATYEGWPARDQIGRGQDAWLWTTQNPFPPQASEPAYFWNNKRAGTGVDLLPFLHNNNRRQPKHLVAGRDFYANTPRPGYTPYTYPHPLRND